MSPGNPTPPGPQPATGNAVDAQAALAELDRSLMAADVMQRNGYPYLIHPLMDGVPRAHPDILQAWAMWAKCQVDIVAGATLLLAPEAMGLPLVAALSLTTGIPYGVVRKRRYDLPGEKVAFAETGYGDAALHINDVSPADRVVLVDDVMSTGGTVAAILVALKAMDVKAQGVLLFVDKGTRRRAIEAAHDVPVRAMRTITVESGKVRIVAIPDGPP